MKLMIIQNKMEINVYKLNYKVKSMNDILTIVVVEMDYKFIGSSFHR